MVPYPAPFVAFMAQLKALHHPGPDETLLRSFTNCAAAELVAVFVVVFARLLL